MRTLIYVSVSVLLLVLALAGIEEATAFRAMTTERETRLARETLQAWVDQWEDSVAERTSSWLGELSAGDPAVAVGVLRRSATAFEGYYRWDPAGVTVPAGTATEDLRALRREPCLARAAANAGRGDYADAGKLYEACARRPQLSVAARLLAASEAAELYLNANDAVSARGALDAVAGWAGSPLRTSHLLGVSPRRLVILQVQRARTLDLLGSTDDAERTLATTARAMLELDGAALEQVLPLYTYPVAHDLRVYGGPALAGDDDERLHRAERRLALWTELRDRVEDNGREPVPGVRMLVDPYGDPPWLLAYTSAPDGSHTGVQLDQPALAAGFIARAPPALRNHLSVRTPAGRLLEGAASPLEVEVAFTRVLPHLRAGLTPGAISLDARASRALATQLLPIGIGLVMGTMALLTLVANDRRQQRLLNQQREFMTRVTHELKTPLAGIRLMAETIELGAFRDAAQREKFAQQIVKEAERLGERLDDVIRSAARPLEETREEIDLARMLAELVAVWRPRFEQQRGRLEMVLPDGPVLCRVKPVQLRDAVTNLLDNALKYRSPDRPLACLLRLRADRKHAVIEVLDNGLGVPLEKRRAIFERFSRVEGPGRGHAGGHGLGLAFVADAARAHGGKVDCREGADGGSLFVLRIRRT